MADDIELEAPEETHSMRSFVYVPEETVEEEHDPESLNFDPKYREPFTGLLYLGSLKETFKYLGHTFKIETPSELLRLEAGQIHKPYANTVSAEAAWAAVVVACFLTEVDGEDLPEGLGPKDSGLEDRFFWVLTNLKGSIINYVYERTLTLDYHVNEILTELDRTGKETA